MPNDKFKATVFKGSISDRKHFAWVVGKVERIIDEFRVAPRTPGITQVEVQWSAPVILQGLDKRYPRQPTLIWRDEQGVICGILIYYPVDYPMWLGGSRDRAGEFHLIVRQDRRRQGIGTALLQEGIKRYHIDLGKQSYTRAGSKFVNAFVALKRT